MKIPSDAKREIVMRDQHDRSALNGVRRGLVYRVVVAGVEGLLCKTRDGKFHWSSGRGVISWGVIARCIDEDRD